MTATLRIATDDSRSYGPHHFSELALTDECEDCGFPLNADGVCEDCTHEDGAAGRA